MGKLIAILFLFFATTVVGQPLRVSDRGLYLEKANGQPFFWLADTGWELFHRLDRPQAHHYLQTRANQGFTVIQAVLLAEFDGFRSPNAYGDLPFKGEDPTQPLVSMGHQWNIPEQYDFWDHAEWIVQQAQEMGLAMCLLPSWGEWITPRFGPFYFKNEEQAYRYGHFLGKRFAKYDNVVWMLGGDRLPDERPEGVAIWRAMAEGIADGSNGADKRDGKADYTTTLMTYHCFATSATWFHQDAWIDFHSWGSYHKPSEYMRAFTEAPKDLALPNPKPTLNSEPNYEMGSRDYLQDVANGVFDDFEVRNAAYWSLCTGAFGHTYGNNAIWQFYQKKVGERLVHIPLYWEESLSLPGALQMVIAKRLFCSRPFHTLRPAPQLLPENQEISRDYLAAVQGDRFAFVYFPRGATATLRLASTAPTRWVAWWFDPRTGNAYRLAETIQGETYTFNPPGESGWGNDWVLVLDDVSAQYPVPGTQW